MTSPGPVYNISAFSVPIHLRVLPTHNPELTLYIGKCKNLHVKYDWHTIWNSTSLFGVPRIVGAHAAAYHVWCINVYKRTVTPPGEAGSELFKCFKDFYQVFINLGTQFLYY